MPEHEFRAFISKKLDLSEHQLNLNHPLYNYDFWYGNHKAYHEILQNFNRLDPCEFKNYLEEWNDILNSAEQLGKRDIGKSNAYSIALEKYRLEEGRKEQK